MTSSSSLLLLCQKNRSISSFSSISLDFFLFLLSFTRYPQSCCPTFHNLADCLSSWDACIKYRVDVCSTWNQSSITIYLLRTLYAFAIMFAQLIIDPCWYCILQTIQGMDIKQKNKERKVKESRQDQDDAVHRLNRAAEWMIAIEAFLLFFYSNANVFICPGNDCLEQDIQNSQTDFADWRFLFAYGCLFANQSRVRGESSTTS